MNLRLGTPVHRLSQCEGDAVTTMCGRTVSRAAIACDAVMDVCWTDSEADCGECLREEARRAEAIAALAVGGQP